MRSDDLKRLSAPYALTTDGHPISDLPKALGCAVVPLRDLLTEVRSDLGEENFGIGWWRRAPEEGVELRRRIIVGDYLVSVLEGIECALVDFEVHRLELLDHLDREAHFVRDALALNSGRQFVATLPPRRSALDDLAPAMVDIHIAGLLRAGASVLDCLAGAVAIIGALETDVLRVGWRDVLSKLKKSATGNQRYGVDGNEARVQLQRTLQTAIESALTRGAPNWCDWLLSYRNLVVHRGHRLKLTKLTPTPSLFDARGNRTIRPLVVPVLCGDPEVSDVEALGMMAKHPPVLEEDGRRTFEGLGEDLRLLTAETCASLLDAWRKRRVSPALQGQPFEKQWPTVRRASQSAFKGYHPGSSPFDPGSMTANPNFLRRMKAAALFDPASKLWTEE